MELSTLVEYQRCFNLLRQAELSGKRLPVTEYLNCIEVMVRYDMQLAKLLEQEVCGV